MNGFIDYVYTVSHWILRLIYVNVVWMLLAMLGLVVFGLFPATTAMFAVVRRWILGERDTPVFQTFWRFYKADFMKSNLLGLPLTLISLLLYVDVQLFQQAEGGVLQLLYIPFLLVCLLYAVMLLYILPVFVHYDMTIMQVMKHAFFTAILHPVHTIMMLLGVVIITISMLMFPGAIPLFSGSLTAFFLMRIAYTVFQKGAQKQQVI